jgi:hypothetical protein
MADENDTSFQRWWFESHYGGERGGKFSGDSHSLTLDFDQLDDSRFVKSFKLPPGARYTFTIHAIGRDIETQNPDGVGANICVYGSWSHSSEHNKGSGTFEGDLSVTFRVPPNGELQVGLRLGFWCCEAKGIVTFSDLRISRCEEWVTIGIGQVRLDLLVGDVATLDRRELERFVQRMSGVYFAMARLYGRVPFDGAPVFYETRDGIDAWAWAGNPVVWNRGCCLGYFRGLERGDDACFGTMHEMGHNFDQTVLSAINCEMMANFSLCYAAEVIGLPVAFDNEFTVGRGLQDGFYRRCYEGSIAQRKYSHDGLLYCILRVKDRIGWRPFEQVMRRLLAQETERQPPTQTFAMWMEMLSGEAKADVRQTFPSDEFEFIMAQEQL